MEGSFECDRKVRERTVVVELLFPAEPGASLSQGVVFLAPIEGRYRVWGVYR